MVFYCETSIQAGKSVHLWDMHPARRVRLQTYGVLRRRACYCTLQIVTISVALNRFSIFMRPLLVLGDLLLDIYTWGDAERISPEAPVPVIRVDREEHRLGGAASVARLARGLEAEVFLAGVVGEDLAGRSLRRLLAEDGIDAGLVLEDGSRCTTTRERLVGRAAQRHPHQMVRIDREVLEAVLL
ncbi:MAG: D-heptose-phosphate adenylyltransferase [Planctomycetaceae bacterium]|nr:D-heptose-phosphate adenylyltransferase [Planctomycetaceae bacterium]